MIFKNASVCDDSFKFINTDLIIEDGRFSQTAETAGEEYDCTGLVIIPGFIDIHIHGCCGADCTDLREDSVLRMSEYLASRGVTSFCPATMTLAPESLKQAFRIISASTGAEKGAYIHGINMEGPFISAAKKGAQDGRNIRLPDINLFYELNSICRVRICDIAPELPGAQEFIREVSRICTVSAAHTAADYDTAMRAFDYGITHVTHLFNAMTQFGSREPGLVGAAFDSPGVTCELICDGIHIAPATLRTAFRALGRDRTAVISDAMMASGLPDGEYYLGGQAVIKKGDARLPDGTLAGSVTDLFEEFRNLISFGIPQEQVIRSLSINPARVIGADNETGSIKAGKYADFIILNGEMNEIISVFAKGKCVFEGKNAKKRN